MEFGQAAPMVTRGDKQIQGSASLRCGTAHPYSNSRVDRARRLKLNANINGTKPKLC